MSELFSRRQLFAQAAAVWAAAHAQTRPRFFTPEQAREVEAMAAQIIPADDTPGAREAGVIDFIDTTLATFERDKQQAYIEGLKALGPFAALSPEAQIAKLRSIEKTEFFETVRGHTIAGFFSHPKYGGNRNGAGFRLLGFEDAHMFQPPFGYYDGPEGQR